MNPPDIEHPLTVIVGQTLRILVTLKDAEGIPLPADHASIRGSASDYLGKRHPMASESFDEHTVLLAVPPLPAGRYRYDIFASRSDGLAPRIVGGALSVRERITAPAGQEHASGERIVATITSEQTLIAVTVEEITAVSEADWAAIRTCADRAERAASQAEATLPALEREIAAARTAIEQEADQAARHAAAETADIIAASGEAATSAVRQEASRATSAALESISTAEATAINQAINNGINAIGQSITAGTGTISAATTDGKSSIDTYVATAQADLARKSQPNIWGGVNTFNAPLVANGSIIAQGADLIKTIYTAALMDALYCDTAAGWTDKYAGATSGSGYNSLHYGAESSTSYLGKTASGVLTRTDYAHQMVCKHLAIFGNDCMAGITAVVNLDSNAFWGASNQLTGYCFGQAMQVHADVPFERMIDPEYTPNVGGTPTVMFSAAPKEQVRVDIFYSTIHRQVIVPKIANVTQRSYRQSYVIIWTPNRFMVHLLPAYPATDWRCIARIDARNMNNLYRTNIIGWQDTNSFRVNISLSAHALNTYAAAGYGDWMQPLIHIIA